MKILYRFFNVRQIELWNLFCDSLKNEILIVLTLVEMNGAVLQFFHGLNILLWSRLFFSIFA